MLTSADRRHWLIKKIRATAQHATRGSGPAVIYQHFFDVIFAPAGKYVSQQKRAYTSS